LGSETALTWMERRFDFSAVEDLLGQPGGVAETIEVAHFWDTILATYNELKKALAPLTTEVLSHFSHVYPQGTSLYMILLGRVEDDAAAEERLLQIWDVAMNVCLEHGAAISHHHGVGLARLPYIRRELGASGLVLQRAKEALDPAGILNPGKYGLGQRQ
jgi:alkyldihydroxyacetonephosphate synthase